MKTDKETIVELFKLRGINFKEEPKSKLYENDSILVEAGYIGFVSHFSFDDDGKLLSVEAYE